MKYLALSLSVFFSALTAHAANSEKSSPQPLVQCISRIWIRMHDPAKPKAGPVSVRGPSLAGTGGATTEGHKELGYEVVQNTVDHNRSGKPVPFHFSVASGPNHIASTTGSVEGDNVIRLDINSGNKDNHDLSGVCRIDFFNVICASSAQSIQKFLDNDPPMKTPALESLPSGCLF
jgi:hypothetical protein